MRQLFLAARAIAARRDDLPASVYPQLIQQVHLDNNASERALGNSVIHRKVTGGFRSDAGATAFVHITTIVQTAHKNGLPIFQTLRPLLIPSPLDLLDST